MKKLAAAFLGVVVLIIACDDNSSPTISTPPITTPPVTQTPTPVNPPPTTTPNPPSGGAWYKGSIWVANGKIHGKIKNNTGVAQPASLSVYLPGTNNLKFPDCFADGEVGISEPAEFTLPSSCLGRGCYEIELKATHHDIPATPSTLAASQIVNDGNCNPEPTPTPTPNPTPTPTPQPTPTPTPTPNPSPSPTPTPNPSPTPTPTPSPSPTPTPQPTPTPTPTPPPLTCGQRINLFLDTTVNPLCVNLNGGQASECAQVAAAFANPVGSLNGLTFTGQEAQVNNTFTWSLNADFAFVVDANECAGSPKAVRVKKVVVAGTPIPFSQNDIDGNSATYCSCPLPQAPLLQ